MTTVNNHIDVSRDNEAANGAANDDVSNLCSRRLWEILQLSNLKNVSVADELLLRIEAELAAREHQNLYAPDKAPYKESGAKFSAEEAEEVA